MPQCGRLFDELERQPGKLRLEEVLVKMKYESQQRTRGDMSFSKAIIDFKKQIMLGAHTLIHDDIECELIPMTNISRISIPRRGRAYSNVEPHRDEPEVEVQDESPI